MKQKIAATLFAAVLVATLAACAAVDREPDQALQERETLLDEREAELSRREEELARREQAAALRESELDTLAEAVDERMNALAGAEDSGADGSENGPDAAVPNPGTEPVLSPGAEPTPEQEAAAAQERAQRRWMESLDPAITGGVFWDEDENFCINVLDLPAFEQSETLREGIALGIPIRLIPAQYSTRELQVAQDKLTGAMARFQISAIWVDVFQNRLCVGTVDDSEKNKQAIRDYCGHNDILFEKATSLINPTT